MLSIVTERTLKTIKTVL